MMGIFNSSVYLYPANIIGMPKRIISSLTLIKLDYGRIVSLLLALYFYHTNGILTIIFYAMSQLLDCLDGYLARLFKQESSFGAVLDMVTDRFSSAAFALCVSHSYPDYMMGFCLFIILDFGSHWIQMYATLLWGEKHHKKQESKFKLMRLYYDSKFVLFCMCFGSEMFLINLYIHSHPVLLGLSPLIVQINTFLLIFVATPIFALKQFISVICLLSSIDRIVKFDLKNKKN